MTHARPTILENSLTNLERATFLIDGEVPPDILDKLRLPVERIELSIDPQLSDGALDLPARRNLLLAVKEALRNVMRHSKAS